MRSMSRRVCSQPAVTYAPSDCSPPIRAASFRGTRPDNPFFGGVPIRVRCFSPRSFVAAAALPNASATQGSKCATTQRSARSSTPAQHLGTSTGAAPGSPPKCVRRIRRYTPWGMHTASKPGTPTNWSAGFTDFGSATSSSASRCSVANRMPPRWRFRRWCAAVPHSDCSSSTAKCPRGTSLRLAAERSREANFSV